MDPSTEQPSHIARSKASWFALGTIALLLAAVVAYQAYEVRTLSQRVALLAAQDADAQAPGPPARNLDINQWDPRAELQRMQQQMDQLFGATFSRFNPAPHLIPPLHSGAFAPSVDLEETQDAYVARVDVPGAKESQINVEVKGDVLYISGETRSETDDTDPTGQVLREERFEGRFERAIPLSEQVDPDKMTTKYDDGVLTITLPLKAPAESAKSAS